MANSLRAFLHALETRKKIPDWRFPALHAWKFATQLLTVIALIGSTIGANAAESDTDVLTGDCKECHGVDGIGVKPGIPHLNGQHEERLVDMMESFHLANRTTKVKAHRDVAPKKIPLIAKHYSSQKAKRPASLVNKDLLARGEDIYLTRCTKCHPDSGRESDFDAPLLAGQDMVYLIEQALAFKNGERKFPHMMDRAYLDLGEAELTAAAHYFASQDQVSPQEKRRRRR
jgi:cytochrome c553